MSDTKSEQSGKFQQFVHHIQINDIQINQGSESQNVIQQQNILLIRLID